MKRQYSLITLLCACILCVAATFACTVFGYQKMINSYLLEADTLKQKYAKLIKLDNLVRENYIYEIDEDLLLDSMLSGYSYGLDDPHTYYLSAEAYADTYEELTGNFAGIGIKVIYDTDTGLIYLAYVMPGSPAEAAGLQCGDLIESVGGASVLEMGYNEAVDALLGEAGTNAEFTVLRDGQSIPFSVTRNTFEVQTVTWRTLDSGYACVRIEELDMKTYDQFIAVLNEILAQDVPGIVFDLRDNPGGELTAICDVLDRLVPSGVIIEIVDKEGVSETIRSDDEELNLPMAVLVDGGTASAAELFTATLRDYDKAVLVGETTYGKGSVQTLFPLGDGSGINLTCGLYYPASGESYDGIGITPDIEVALPDELVKKLRFLTEEEDVQLQQAVQALEQQVQQAAPAA